MLRACVLIDSPKWDKHIPLVEFSYNNRYQESIKMSPFEALYRQPCPTTLSWSKSDEMVIFGLDNVTEAKEKVKQIQANILATQSHQKSNEMVIPGSVGRGHGPDSAHALFNPFSNSFFI
jgi:hypothetical protein